MGPAQIEKRIAALEEELARLRSKVEKMDALKPWWERIAGTFQDDPVYEKAMKLGRHYRRSLKPGPWQAKAGAMMLVLDTDHMSVLEWGGERSAALRERLADFAPHGTENGTSLIFHIRELDTR